MFAFMINTRPSSSNSSVILSSYIDCFHRRCDDTVYKHKSEHDEDERDEDDNGDDKDGDEGNEDEDDDAKMPAKNDVISRPFRNNIILFLCFPKQDGEDGEEERGGGGRGG